MTILTQESVKMYPSGTYMVKGISYQDKIDIVINDDGEPIELINVPACEIYSFVSFSGFMSEDELIEGTLQQHSGLIQLSGLKEHCNEFQWFIHDESLSEF